MSSLLPSSIRSINRLRILDLLRSHAGASRADIAKLLGINKPTCSEIVDALVAEGLVKEGKKTETRTGRRPTPLSLDGTKLVAAFDFGTRTCSLAVAAVTGSLLGFKQIPTPEDTDPKALCILLLTAFLRMYRGDAHRIIGCALTIEGDISPDGQSVVRQSDWGWKDVPLAAPFSRNLHCETRIFPRATAIALAQAESHPDAPVPLLSVYGTDHILAARFDGRTLEESRLGHVKIAETGTCRCGGTGCLETVGAGWALQERLGMPLREAKRKTPEAYARAMEQASLALGMVLVLANAAAPAATLVIDGIGADDARWRQLVLQAMQAGGTPAVRLPALVYGTLGEKAPLYGALAMAREAFLFHKLRLAALDLVF